VGVSGVEGVGGGGGSGDLIIVLVCVWMLFVCLSAFVGWLISLNSLFVS